MSKYKSFKSETYKSLGCENSKAIFSPEQIRLLFPTLLAFLSYNLLPSKLYLEIALFCLANLGFLTLQPSLL